MTPPRSSPDADAECCSCGPIRARRRRWCLTPTIGHSRCSGAAAGAASTTTMETAVETSSLTGPALQSPLPANVQPLSGRASGLHAGVGLVRERFFTPRLRFRLSASTATRFSMMRAVGPQCQCAYPQPHHRPGHDRSGGWSSQTSGARRARCSPRRNKGQRCSGARFTIAQR